MFDLDKPLFGINRLGIPGLLQPISLGILWIPIAVFIIHAHGQCGEHDRWPGWLGGADLLVAYAAYGVVAYLQGQVFLTMLCMVMVGALLGFLWFNVHPAQLFMGGLGSESLGAMLGVIALMTGQWLLLPIIAIVPVAEALSVIIQVSVLQTDEEESMAKANAFLRCRRCTITLCCWAGASRRLCNASWLIGFLLAWLAWVWPCLATRRDVGECEVRWNPRLR